MLVQRAGMLLLVSGVVHAAGCSGANSCGNGTKRQNSLCIPDGPGATCAVGTRLDDATSTCVVDPSACGPGTAFSGGVCVPQDDPASADVEEATEPNDATMAGSFTVPAVGSSVVAHGCLEPVNGVADVDRFLIAASEPSVLEVTVDGVHGLAGGFELTGPGAALSSWRRLGLTTSGDVSTREVFLPAGGTYVLHIDDVRALTLHGVAGGTGQCYFATVKRLKFPDATPLDLPQTNASDDGRVRVFDFTASADDLISLTATPSDPTHLVAGLVALRDAELLGVGTTEADGASTLTVGPLDAGQKVAFISDAVSNLGGAQTFRLDGTRAGAEKLPIGGETITVTNHNGAHAGEPWLERNYLAFDVAEDDGVLRFDLQTSKPVTMRIVRRLPHSDAADPANTILEAGVPVGSFVEFVHFLHAGRYFFVVDDPSGTAGETFTVRGRVDQLSTLNVAFGSPGPTHTLGARRVDFYKLKVNPSFVWAGIFMKVVNWGAQLLTVNLYDLSCEGVLGRRCQVLQHGELTVDTVSETTTGFGRFVQGDPRSYLIRLDGPPPQSDAPTLVALAVSERQRDDVGPLPAGVPLVHSYDVSRVDEFGNPLPQLVALHGMPGQTVDIEVSGEATLSRLDAAESEVVSIFGSRGPALAVTFGPGEQIIPISLAGPFGAEVTYAVHDLSAHVPYVNICGIGTSIDLFSDQLFSEDYTFYEQPVSSFVVEENGFLSFGNPTCFDCSHNEDLSAGSLLHAIAPYWDDLDGVTVCRFDNGESVTIQWTGFISSSFVGVQFQAILHRSGIVDLVYGPDHHGVGVSATVGVVGASAASARQRGFNQAGVVAPELSITMTTP